MVEGQESTYKKIKSYSKVIGKKNGGKRSTLAPKDLATDRYEKEKRIKNKTISAGMAESIRSQT